MRLLVGDIVHVSLDVMLQTTHDGIRLCQANRQVGLAPLVGGVLSYISSPRKLLSIQGVYIYIYRATKLKAPSNMRHGKWSRRQALITQKISRISRTNIGKANLSCSTLVDIQLDL